MLVLQEVLRGLPTSTEMLRQTLVSLGSLARTSVTDEALLPALEQLRQATIDHQTQLATLPVRAVGAAADGSVTINRELASPLLRRLFPTAMLSPGQGPLPRAIVIGAGGTAGQIAQVVADLSAAGIAVVSGGQQSPGLTQVQFDPALTESHDLAHRTVAGNRARCRGANKRKAVRRLRSRGYRWSNTLTQCVVTNGTADVRECSGSLQQRIPCDCII